MKQAYDLQVSIAIAQHSYNGWIWYQHWWTENLRSTVETSGIWNAANTNILGACTSCNKCLAVAHANLIWSPVAFVDLGAEFGWGHRVTTQNFKGDAYGLKARCASGSDSKIQFRPIGPPALPAGFFCNPRGRTCSVGPAHESWAPTFAGCLDRREGWMTGSSPVKGSRNWPRGRCKTNDFPQPDSGGIRSGDDD